MRNRKHTRGLSLLLCAALLAGQLGTTVYAEGSSPGNREVVCEHHPEHTEVCGYMEAEPGHPCKHEHTGDCYTDELICGFDDEDTPTATDSDATTVHEHTQECYALDCPHERGEHDEDCGYVEAVKGQPCAFVCDECDKKEPEADNENNPPAPDLPEPDHKQPEEAEVFTITDFDGLDEAVQYQTVSPGTKLDELNLPTTLRASGYKVNDAEGGRESPLGGTVTDNTEPTSEPITIQGVTWEPDEAYDDTAEQGGYIFTPVLPDGYTRATGVELPEIYVRIGEANVMLDVQGGVLTVNFDSNGSGGTYTDNNEMKTAIEAALSTFSSGDQTSVITIKLTGGATEITRYNWRYLLERYHRDSGWDSLTTLDLSGMTSLESMRNDTDSTRGYITKLQTLILPPDLTQIGDYAFSYCHNLALESLPDGVTQIGVAAFEDCKNLALQSLPSDLTQIGGSAFFGCKSLVLQSLPPDLTQIGDSAFFGCESLALQSLPDGVTQIGDLAFRDCERLALQALPDCLTQIGRSAFAGCERLALQALPPDLTQIGRSAFAGCTGLDKIIMEPTTAPTLGTGAFENTSSGLTFNVPRGGTGYNSGGWENLNTVEYSPTISLAFDQKTLQLESRESATLTPTFEPVDATYQEVSWKSSDTSVATVDGNGKVTAVSNGTATITATTKIGGKEANCTVTVQPPAPATVSVTGVKLNNSTYTLYTNIAPQTIKLIATVEPTNAADKTVSWKSNDTTVATVDGDGNVIAVSNGKATITVTTKDGNKTASCDVTVETYSSGNGGGGDDSSSSNSRTYVTTPEPPKPDSPVLAVVETPVTVKDGTATGTASDRDTSEAITKALNAAKQKVREKYGIALRYDATTAAAYDGFSITLKRAALDCFLDPDNGVKYMTLHTPIVDMTFGLAELTEIACQTSGDVTFTAARAPGLTGDALSAIGTRPAYDLKISYQKDGKPIYLSSVGSVSVGLAYTPAETEQAGGLYLVYVDGKDGAQWLYRSSYDGSGSVIGSVEHFSVYGVGYKPAPAFTDTANHWAKPDIDFVVSRGLFSGTSDTTFSPNSTITRGMFVTALGRLAGIDPAAYPSSSRFTDVAMTEYYAPFVEWAASKGIVNGAGANTFEPGRAVTREEMAVIMRRYADKLGYTLPVAREAEIFADDAKITSSMKDAVQAMQQAGVMNGKGGHLFAPKDTATRAEAAAVLRRFVEVVIDRDTAEGWTQNEAGGWLYYENNKPVTGWKQLESKWYYFYADGSMAANTEIDGYQIGPDGARNS